MERAVHRAREWLAQQGTALELAVARVLGVSGLPRIEGQVPAGQLPDGSWDGSVGATARALIALAMLPTRPSLSGEAGAGLMWLRRRRQGRGTWPRCERGLHERRLCPHWAGGFFAPGGGDADPPRYRTLGGGAIEGVPATLALSALALAAEREWSEPGRDALLHADALRRLVADRSAWTQVDGEPAATLAPVVGALLRFGADDPVVWHALVLAERAQRGDGTWPDVDTFEMLELLLAAVRHGYRGPGIDRSIARGAELLVMTQQEHGGWGRGVEGPARFGWSMDAVGAAALEHALRSTGSSSALH